LCTALPMRVPRRLASRERRAGRARRLSRIQRSPPVDRCDQRPRIPLHGSPRSRPSRSRDATTESLTPCDRLLRRTACYSRVHRLPRTGASARLRRSCPSRNSHGRAAGMAAFPAPPRRHTLQVPAGALGAVCTFSVASLERLDLSPVQ
jgi:hypothetical protein